MIKRVSNQVATIIFANLASLFFANTSSSQVVLGFSPNREQNFSKLEIPLKLQKIVSQPLVTTEVNTAQSLPDKELLDGIQLNETELLEEIIEVENKPEKIEPQQPQTQEIEINKPKLTQEQEQQQKQIILEAVVIDGLTQTAQKYPWLVNSADKLIINPKNYNPAEANTSVNIDFSLDNSMLTDGAEVGETQNQVLNKLNFSQYTDSEQFYWILDDNRVVIETQGVHGDVRLQGRSTEVNQTQKAVISQRLWGVQAVWALPSVISGLSGDEKSDGVSVTAIAAEITNPPGFPVGGITIDTGFDLYNPSVIDLDDLAKGDTFAEAGGGALFDNLDADNAPNFLQGFPTVNIQPLIDGETKLELEENIPEENLKRAGIQWGDFFTREGFQFASKFSSLPGVKRLRPNQGSNEDLVKILSNPFLTQEERDFHYLNSLIWFNFGQTSPEFELLNFSIKNNNWYRIATNFSHNRTLIQYDADKIEAKYTNVFSNPGVSLTFTPLFNKVNIDQTLNASLGMALGSLFKLADGNDLNASLSEAKEKYQKLKPLARLKTKATSQQRRAINVRLNSTLSYANANSNLAQVSGSWTFSGKSTPKDSQIFQVRTGIYKRGIYFREEEFKHEPESPTYFSQLRLSNEDFGPFVFRGERFPIENTSITPKEQAIATQTIVKLPDGRSFITNFNSRDRAATTTVPLINSKSSDVAFDIIELSKSRVSSARVNNYIGLLYLPSIELLMAGSSGNFKYSFSFGGWLNIDPNSAPDVGDSLSGNRNNNITDEFFTGAYTRLGLNWTFQDFMVNSENRIFQVASHVPFLIFDGNSAANQLNPNTLLLGYQFQLNNRNFNISLTPSISYRPKFINSGSKNQFDNRSTIAANFFSSFYTRSGLATDLSFSIADKISFEVEALHKVISKPGWGTLSVGGYYSNFDTLNRGITSTLYKERLGLTLNYLAPKDKTYLKLQVGFSGSQFDTRMQGGFKFKF